MPFRASVCYDLTLQWAGILEAEHGLILTLPFKASVCYQIEILPEVKVWDHVSSSSSRWSCVKTDLNFVGSSLQCSV